MASHVDSYLLLAPAWSNSFIWPRVYNFSLLAPAWGSSFFVMSRVDSFSLLAPAWGSSPAWRISLLILPSASPARLLDVWYFFFSRQQLSLL